MGLGLEVISPLEAATNWGLCLAFWDEELRHLNCHGAVRVASLLCKGESYSSMLSIHHRMHSSVERKARSWSNGRLAKLAEGMGTG